ncbi:type II toxin-antitoxin system death-on-curing family toxin [Cellulomonas xiejunii]|uniref:type II toxin-antitoxin system death-on-curing family toxin n=1 Tax=Cellulomonas xiejunii TaxID=2968083 RepID=UPI001D0F244F|nr:Fic family protein [Cellulomonas xiejunii]MCC2314073.1 Fic family protein [Cellulomonas xiejunii]
MSLWYPTLDTAGRICDRFGLHIRDAGALASALARPSQVVWGAEAYVGLHLKAAALLDAINRSHPLHDGNKRLSWVLVASFYEVNGCSLVVEPSEGDAFIRGVGGDDHLDLEQIGAWLAEHVVEHPHPADHRGADQSS